MCYRGYQQGFTHHRCCTPYEKEIRSHQLLLYPLRKLVHITTVHLMHALLYFALLHSDLMPNNSHFLRIECSTMLFTPLTVSWLCVKGKYAHVCMLKLEDNTFVIKFVWQEIEETKQET